MSISHSEKNRLENIDLLQIAYFADIPTSTKDVIVIESSQPIAITIHRFLTSLGFENIHICKNPSEGIQIFSDFINNEINVPVILDDNYSNSKETVKGILEINSNANIIILTTKEKNEADITKLIDMGVSSISHKPLNFEELKKSFWPTLDGNDDNKNTDIENAFEMTLSSSNRISQNKIKDLLKIDKLEMEVLIRKAIHDQRIVLYKESLEPACNQCNSTNITYLSECPNCQEINFKQEPLIEHYNCGHVFPRESNQNTCPKCNKNIGSAGVDYKESKDRYVCNNCGDKFPKPSFKFLCLECNNHFIEMLALWDKNKIYQTQK